MANALYNTLFLDTRDSNRAILAEALMNLKGQERFRAFSAGTQPAGTVNHVVIELLQRLAIPTSSLRSKSWHEFAATTAPAMDFIFVLCDKAAAEQCPQWPGHPITALWSIPDPSLAEGTDIEKSAEYRAVFSMLERRISLLLSLPLESIDRMSLEHHFSNIGRDTQHASASAVLHPGATDI